MNGIKVVTNRHVVRQPDQRTTCPNGLIFVREWYVDALLNG